MAEHRVLDIVPDFDLTLMRADQRLGELFGRMASALDRVLCDIEPDVVVVQGDTLTVMVAAIVSFLCGAEVAHVEAGLRTNDKRQPFPEEANRRLAGVVADHHFAPTPAARDALLGEGMRPDSIHVTGNTGIDALHWMRARHEGGERAADRALESVLQAGRRLVLVTAHRRESFGAPFRAPFEPIERCINGPPNELSPNSLYG